MHWPKVAERIGIEALKDRYRKRYAAEFGTPKGSSEGQIRELEASLKCELPTAYRDYLLWMGNDRNGRLQGSNWFLENVAENNEILPDLLTENGLKINDGTRPLCFFTHQGYMAAWFDLEQKQQDPDCYYFFESRERCQIEGPMPFTQFLAKDLGLD